MSPIIPMRRKRQALDEGTCTSVLERGTAGVLALNDPTEGTPYQVPLSYAYHDGRLVFHGATSGHKLDLLKIDERASFTVIDQDKIVPEEYTTYFRSVICTGRLRIVQEPEEKRKLLMILGDRYWPGHDDDAAAAIGKSLDHMTVLVLDVEHISGKEAIELVRQREKNLERQ